MTIEDIQQHLPANYTPDAKSLGKRLRSARQARNVTARELARMLNIHPGSIYHWERGVYVPGALNLQKTSIILGMPVEYFLGLELQQTATGFADNARQLLSQIGHLFGESESDWSHWSPAALNFLSSVLEFGISPSPESLSSLLQHHPLSSDSENAPPMLRWSKRAGLVEWLLSATESGLDVVEDVVRRLSSK